MSKATPAQLQGMGFHGSQFSDTDESGFTAYLQLVLDDVATIVESRVTSAVYAAATGVTLVRITRAERFLAAADLWYRREVYENRALTTSNDDERAGGESRNVKNANDMEALAEKELSRVTGDDSESTSASGVATGALETGNYPLATD